MASISSMKMMRGRPLARLGEQVADPGRADPDEQLHEAGAGHREERHARLARDRAGQQRLAGTGRPDHQDAARHRRADLGVPIRMLEEVHYLGDLGLGAVVAGHVGERGGRPFLVEDLGPRLAHAEHALELAGRALGQPPEQPDEQYDRQPEHDQVDQHFGAKLCPDCDAEISTWLSCSVVSSSSPGLRRDDHGEVLPVGQRPAARTAGRAASCTDFTWCADTSDRNWE